MQVQELFGAPQPPLLFIRAAFGRAPWPTFDRDLVQALHRHGLAAFAYARLGEQRAALPAAIRDELRAAVMANLHAEQTRAEPLACVLRALAAIPAIAFKGLDYAYRLYGDPSERPMGDHDLLVPEERFEEALRALENIGYRSALDQRGVAALGEHYAAQLVRAGHHVDLHRAVRQKRRASVDYGAIAARSIVGDLRGTPIRWLDPRDRVLLHCYHQAAHELSVPLVTFVDLELMGPVDRVTLGRAEEYGISRPLLAALSLRDELFGFVPRYRRPRVLPTPAEIVAGEPPSRALQLVRKACLFDSPRALARFAAYSARALF